MLSNEKQSPVPDGAGRKKAYTAGGDNPIRESEQMFRSIVENSHAGIFIVDDSFHIVYSNDQLSSVLGYPLNEILGADFRHFLDENSVALVADRYIRRQKGETMPSRYEIGGVRKDGGHRDLELSSAVIKGADGKIITVGQVLDITERKNAESELAKAHAELEKRVEERTVALKRTNELLQREIDGHHTTQEALKQSEFRYRDVVENANCAIMEIDTKGNISFFNRAAQDLFGYGRDEIIGRNVVGTLITESNITALEVVNQILKNAPEAVIRRSQYRSSELENICKDGDKVWIAWTSRPVFDSGGRLEKIVCIGINRTEQKQAEEQLRLQEIEKDATREALRQNELKFRHLVENSNSIILIMGPHGEVNFLNPFGLEFFGFAEDEIMGRNVMGTIVPETDTSGRDLDFMIKDIMRNPDRYRHNENENITRDGKRVWIVWTNQPLFDEKGELQEVLCVGIDRTQQKMAEVAREEEEREKAAIGERTRLARDLHDAVSQTLFSASLIAEVLPRIWEKNQPEGRKRLEEIRQLTKGALAEMRTLLLELRPAALADTELGDLLHQLGESITGRARVPVDVTVEGECHILTPEVKVALYRIAQEALNNVAKHSGARRARVELDCEETQITLTIADNGRGFDVKSAPPNSLGLGIMRERAKGIGAEIAIASEIGKGTEVKVLWHHHG